MFVLEHINNAVSTLLGLWALWNYRILSQVFLLVGMFLLFSGVSQFIAYFLAIYFQTNMVFYGIALVIHLVLVSAIFYQLLEIPKNKLRLLVVAILGGLPIASLSIYQIILDSTFSFFAIIFSNVLFTTFAYLYL